MANLQNKKHNIGRNKWVISTLEKGCKNNTLSYVKIIRSLKINRPLSYTQNMLHKFNIKPTNKGSGYQCP